MYGGPGGLLRRNIMSQINRSGLERNACATWTVIILYGRPNGGPDRRTAFAMGSPLIHSIPSITMFVHTGGTY